MTEYAFATDTLAENPQLGMTLRDYFAGQALVGLLANYGNGGYDTAASYAYGFADAMLAERSKVK